jgi:branched-chain amino acid transport system permease protein
MDIQLILQQLVSGLALGCVYGLIALGYSLIWNAVAVINLAQGAFVMVGAFVYGATFVRAYGWPAFPSFFAMIIFMALFGMLCERVFYRPLRYAAERTKLVALLALSMLLCNLALIAWGPYPMGLKGPFGQKLLSIKGVTIPYQNIYIIAVTIILLVIQQYIFHKTTLGKVLRAVAQDKDTASLMGINSDQAVSFTFAYSAILAGIAGMLIAPIFVIGTTLSSLGFMGYGACIIGSFTHVPGALLGGFVIGIFEVLSASYISSLYKSAIVYLLIIAFLLFRPQGLLGKKEEVSSL